MSSLLKYSVLVHIHQIFAIQPSDFLPPWHRFGDFFQYFYIFSVEVWFQSLVCLWEKSVLYVPAHVRGLIAGQKQTFVKRWFVKTWANWVQWTRAHSIFRFTILLYSHLYNFKNCDNVFIFDQFKCIWWLQQNKNTICQEYKVNPNHFPKYCNKYLTWFLLKSVRFLKNFNDTVSFSTNFDRNSPFTL